MDFVWNEYIHKKKPETKIGHIQNNKYLKKYDQTYNEIRNHVLETHETKENHLSQVISSLPKKKLNIHV